MGFYTKRYYKRRSEELAEERDKLRGERNSLKDSVRFLLRQKSPYAVQYEAAVTHWGASDTRTNFEYVDGSGVLHNIDRPFKYANLTCLTSSADAAIFAYAGELGVTYWILNKAEELFAEIPEQYICHRGDKICEIKGEPTNE